MHNLRNIFNPRTVARLSDEVIQDITEESQGRAQERHKLEERIAALSRGEELLRQACSKIYGSTAI